LADPKNRNYFSAELIIKNLIPLRMFQKPTPSHVRMGQRRRLRESLFPGVPPYHVFLPLGEEYQEPVCQGRSKPTPREGEVLGACVPW